MAALLVSIGVMSIMLTMAMPAWRHQAQREKEAELVFRGEQYARAIGLFQRKYAGAFPPSVDLLIEQRFLRKRYTDPMSPDGEFQILYLTSQQAPGLPQSGAPGQPAAGPPAAARPPAGSPSVPPGQSVRASGPGAGQSAIGAQAGIIGVTSKSREQSIMLYKGRDRYDQWQFVHSAVTMQPGQPPGMMPRPGQPAGMPPTLTPGRQRQPPGFGQPPQMPFPSPPRRGGPAGQPPPGN